MIQLTIHFLIKIYLDNNEHKFLGCTPNGLEWKYLKVEGSMFLLLHMSCICLQAIMIEKVFFSVPKSMGYYDFSHEQKDEDEIELRAEDEMLTPGGLSAIMRNKFNSRNSHNSH